MRYLLVIFRPTGSVLSIGASNCLIVFALIAGLLWAIPYNVEKAAKERQQQEQFASNYRKYRSDPNWGLRVEEITPQWRRNCRKMLYPRFSHTQAVIVASTLPASPAATAGLKQWDIIYKVGDRRVTSVPEFERAIKRQRGAHCKIVTLEIGQLYNLEPHTTTLNR